MTGRPSSQAFPAGNPPFAIATAMTPAPTPIRNIPRIVFTTASGIRCMAGRSADRASVGSVIENLLDRQAEQARDLEREREGRIVFAGLDGVDRLPGHVEVGA